MGFEKSLSSSNLWRICTVKIWWFLVRKKKKQLFRLTTGVLLKLFFVGISSCGKPTPIPSRCKRNSSFADNHHLYCHLAKKKNCSKNKLFWSSFIIQSIILYWCFWQKISLFFVINSISKKKCGLERASSIIPYYWLIGSSWWYIKNLTPIKKIINGKPHTLD